MTKNSFVEHERRQLKKVLGFRLPYKMMILGMVIVGLSILGMFIRGGFYATDTEWLRLALQKALLIGLLIMSLSSDKEEDEMTINLRAQSYSLAFIVGVIYAIVMPYVEFGVSNVVHNGGEAYKDLGDFQVLLFMLMIQLMFYHVLKRYR